MVVVGSAPPPPPLGHPISAELPIPPPPCPNPPPPPQVFTDSWGVGCTGPIVVGPPCQQQPKGPQGSSGVVPKSRFSADPCRPENGQVLIGGVVRGTDLENLETVLGTPIIGQGVHMEEKSGMGPGSEPTHSGGDKPTKLAYSRGANRRFRANMRHQEGLAGAAWLPMALHIPPPPPSKHCLVQAHEPV